MKEVTVKLKVPERGEPVGIVLANENYRLLYNSAGLLCLEEQILGIWREGTEVPLGCAKLLGIPYALHVEAVVQ